MNATYPTKELFARITEPIQRWAIEALAKGTERELWQYLYRVSAGSFGRLVEVDLKEFALFANRALDTVVRALRSLIEKGLVDRKTRMYDYGCRLMLHPPNSDLSPSYSEKLTEKQPSNPHSLVTYSLKSLKEELTTKKESFANSPEQKGGIRSNPAPKLKPQNQEPNPESGTEPTTKALGLIAEYGVTCGSPKLASKEPVQQAIAHTARNLSSEKLAERVRNAIAATEEQRVKTGTDGASSVGCLEALLSVAIARGYTSNASKKLAVAKPAKSDFVIWRDEVLACFPNAIATQQTRDGANEVYRLSDGVFLGTFEELRDLPIEKIGRLINPPSAFNSTEKVAVTPAAIVPAQPTNQPTSQPPTANPTEEDVIEAIAFIPIHEERLGISKRDRSDAIQKFIGVAATGLSRLGDIELIQYLKALQQADPPE